MGMEEVRRFVQEFSGTMVLSDGHKAKALTARANVGRTVPAKAAQVDEEEIKRLVEQEDRMWGEFCRRVVESLPEGPITFSLEKETLERLLASAYSRMVDIGRRNYGPYRPGTDGRDKPQESFEEMDDTVVYTFFDHCDRLVSGQGNVDKLLMVVYAVALVKKAIEDARNAKS